MIPLQCSSNRVNFPLVLVGTFFFAGLLVSPTRASIEWEAEEQSFYPEFWQTSVVAKFTGKNSGSLPITVSRLRPSCVCCTSAEIADDVVGPGEEIDVAVTFKSEGRVGPQMQTVAVESNDSKRPVTLLKMNISVPGKLRVKPPVNLAWKSVEDSSSKRFVVELREKAYADRVRWKVSDPSFKLIVTPLENAPAYEFLVTPDKGSQMRRATISVWISDPSLPTGSPVEEIKLVTNGN